MKLMCRKDGNVAIDFMVPSAIPGHGDQQVVATTCRCPRPGCRQTGRQKGKPTSGSMPHRRLRLGGRRWRLPSSIFVGLPNWNVSTPAPDVGHAISSIVVGALLQIRSESTLVTVLYDRRADCPNAVFRSTGACGSIVVEAVRRPILTNGFTPARKQYVHGLYR